MNARFDKEGNRVPDTGHGCGCQQCANANAARYERRRAAHTAAWSPLRRRLALALRNLIPIRPELA
jgi:hypothetical protein